MKAIESQSFLIRKMAPARWFFSKLLSGTYSNQLSPVGAALIRRKVDAIPPLNSMKFENLPTEIMAPKIKQMIPVAQAALVTLGIGSLNKMCYKTKFPRFNLPPRQ